MIELLHTSFAYGANAVLQDISLRIDRGEFVGIIGANGAGKSTLLKIMAGMLVPLQGSALLDGRAIQGYSRRDVARRLGFVAQSFHSAFDFSVRDIVAMGRFPFQKALAPESRPDGEIIRQSMQETEVWVFRDRSFTSLSGGEQQRVVLASALCQQPDILLLDEPTTALDLHHQQRFYDILRQLSRDRSLTVVTVTHDINLATRYCQRLIALKKGRLLADDLPEHIITVERISEVFDTDVAITPHPNDGKPLVTLP